jgi:hypothetical protein
MKKALLVFCAAMLAAATGHTQAYEATIEYNKKKHQAIVIEFPYSAEAVENAIVDKMSKLGYKAKEEKGIFNKDKGFRVYKNAFVTDISDNSMDYIVKVEPKSRKEKDVSLLYLIVNKNGEDVVKTFDAHGMGKSKEFLNNLSPHVEASHLELQIKAQEETVAKAEKKFKSLQDDQKSMEDKIKKLQDDLKTNAKEQEDAQKDIENQKLALEALQGRRKS